MAPDDGELSVRPVPARETAPLRLRVLRPGLPAESAVYPGDDDPATVHFAAFLHGQVVGIASVYAEGRNGPGWRLRGMATAPGYERRGIASAVLAACVDHVAAHGGGELWCNARTPAVRLYQRAGFEVVSDEFEIAGIGPHVVMSLQVEGDQ